MTGSGTLVTSLNGFEIKYGNASANKNLLPVSALYSKGHLELKNVLIDENICPPGGFVIYNSGILKLENCTLTSGQGGVLCDKGGEVIIEKTTTIESP